MKNSSVQYAVNTFDELRAEHAEIIAELGLEALKCMVRQHPQDVDRGWAFFEIGLDVAQQGIEDIGGRPPDELVFWGKFVQEEKQIQVFLDPETIDSIEFEIYESRPDQA